MAKQRRINRLLTSQPVLILTGAGASQWLGKATTFEIYDAPELQQSFRQEPLSLVTSLWDFLRASDEVVDLEVVLDRASHLRETLAELDATPPFKDQLGRGRELLGKFGEGYEQLLDFVVEYYGVVDEQNARDLYQDLFSGLHRLFSKGRRKAPAISVFTLNYDEAIEAALNSLPGFRLIDGFRDGYQQVWSADVFQDVKPVGSGPVPVALFKLHGSVSWTSQSDSEVIDRMRRVPRRRRGVTHHLLFPTEEPKRIEKEPYSTVYRYLDRSSQGSRRSSAPWLRAQKRAASDRTD